MRKNYFYYLSLASLILACGPMTSENSTTSPDFSSLKIVGGGEVPENDKVALSTVALMTSQKMLICSGTIIGKRYVVSAAHCYTTTPVYVAIGNQKGNGTKKAFIKAKKFIKNTGFNGSRGPDISLVILENDIPDWAVAVPILSPTVNIKKGSAIVMAGFGDTAAGMSVPPRDGFKLRKVTSVFDKVENKEVYVGPTPNKSACHGDSGGSAYYTNAAGVLTLTGIISHNGPNERKDCYQTTVCADVRQLTGWIIDTIAKNK